MTDLTNIPLQRIDGTNDTLASHAGKVLLIVNVASKCGLTPQYAGLEELYQTYRDKGLEVLGFPANDFGGQEPGSNDEIATFCSTDYGVTFPLFTKANVSGAGKQPLYAALIEALPQKRGDAGAAREAQRSHGITPTEDPEVLWNFEKFVIGRDGKVIARFAPTVAPLDDTIVEVLESALASDWRPLADFGPQ